MEPAQQQYAYSTPQLRDLGPLAEMTLGGGGSSLDGNGMNPSPFKAP